MKATTARNDFFHGGDDTETVSNYSDVDELDSFSCLESAMRKRILRAIAIFLGVAIACFMVLWFVIPSQQSRYEDLLLEKTLEQVKTTLDAQPYWYSTKEEWEKQPEHLQWPDDQVAMAHWCMRPKGEFVTVIFDGAGIATRVIYSSSCSMTLKRWLSF
jgi:hypothetical protein